MSQYEPRFTIEQIDLLQRLRHTGMRRGEILHALATLERLDRQHGRRRRAHASPARVSSPASSSAATQTRCRSPSPSNGYAVSPPPPAAPAAAALNGRDGLRNGKLSPPRFPPAPARTYAYEVVDELEIDDKVEELMRRDSSLIKEEIKVFLGNRRISQAVVAQVTGISQSRISHWLLQQGSDLSEQKKRAFYRWYQLEKTSPGATLSMRHAPLALEEAEWMQTPPPISSAPGSFRLRRGSRFTWRRESLCVLESYFSEKQYPDEAQREEIASACNAVIHKPGKKLTELERVTSLKVYNWFANRRKEIKRRANIAAILESHGIDAQSPGGHSHSDDIDGDYSEQVPPVPAGWLAARTQKGPPSGPPSAGRTGAEVGGGPRMTAVTWSPPPPCLQGEQQGPITLAVEMAQQGGANTGIKTETLEED